MTHLTIHEIGGVVVSNRLIRAALLALAATATGAAVFALSHGAVTVPHTYSVSADTAAAPTYDSTITVLPTVVVRADAAPLAARVNLDTTLLPTVRVRAVRTLDRSLAVVGDDDEPALVSVNAVAASSSPGTGYDMPYYSFGKTLRRLNKE